MHTVNKHLIIEIALHFGDIYDATVCQFLEFGIVDICTVKRHNLRCGCNGLGASMKESLVAAEVNRTSQGTPSVGVYDRVYFDATLLLFRSWDVGRHP